MEEDYQVEEIVDAMPGTPHYRVIGFLQDNPLSRALIQSEVVKVEGGMEFMIINQKPCVQFKTSMSTGIYIWPEVQRARSILAKAVSEAKKIEKIVKALELARKG
jgi:hypothetical protein